ncbi:phage tail tube protein [Roseibium suaedae]|uniref:Phage tail protein n=1 Tax=Roseibium suaedae TaxID=735517 RepID=A0A1M7PT13_9HYPH|nr:phage tail tube protein [Roseibium suaedae]SHN20487.1 hypothetical protein SAMN05444272_4620 [Roseibium suaedae]
MATSANPRGKTANLRFKDQGDFSTPAGGDYIQTVFYSESLGEAEGLESDELLGSERNNNRDQEKPAPGLSTHSGDVVVPLCVNHLPYWLTGLLGAPATTGAGPYVHVFTSGKEELPYRTLEIEKRAGAAFFQHVGCLVSSMSFNFNRSAGYRQVTVGLVGRSEEKLGASAAGAPAALLALAQIPAAKGVLRIDGVTAADFLGGSLQVQNNPAADEALNGTKYVSGYLLDDPATGSGSMQVRYKDETYYDLMKAGEPIEVELEFALSATMKISFLMAAVRFEKGPFAPISGPGGLQAELTFRCEQTPTSPMLTVTVTNGIATY